LNGSNDLNWLCRHLDVVGCNHVIEHAQTKAFLRREHPMQVTAAIAYSETPNYRFSFLNLLTIGTTGTERSGGTFGTILFPTVACCPMAVAYLIENRGASIRDHIFREG
jgi:hypothetical protein